MKAYRTGFPTFYLHGIEKDFEERSRCTCSMRIPNFIYHCITRDPLDRTSILLCKTLRCASRKRVFQHDCQLAAHFKSESKHLHGAPTQPQRWASPRCLFHDWARGATSPWLGHPRCLVHPEHVENALAGPYMEVFSAPALTNLLHRKFTPEENLSVIGTFLLTATGWIL